MKNNCSKFHFCVLVTVFALAFLMSSCANKNNDNQWTENNLKGKVKSINSLNYEAVDRFGNIEKGKVGKHSVCHVL